MLTSWPGITPCAQPELDDGMTVPSSSWGRGCPRGHLLTRLWDPEWGPAFWKTNAYAPYPICVAEWPLLGEAPTGQGWHRVRSARQWLPLVRRSGRPSVQLQPTGCQGRAHLLLALVSPT